MVEFVLIKAGKQILSTDFFVLSIEEDRDMPVILCRPFLAFGRILIEIEKGDLIVRLGKVNSY